MDRLTHFIAEINGNREYSSVNYQGQNGGNKQDFINALGLYEDICLTPTEIVGLTKANILVLPCRVGEKAFFLLEKLNGNPPDIIETICIGFRQYLSNGKCSEQWSFNFDCSEIGNSLEFKREDFGKTVFLTEAEAQAALDRKD